MDNVLSFPSRIPITADGQLASIEFVRFLSQLIYRSGGVSAPTIQELDSQQYADAGIEESKAQLYALNDALNALPLPAQSIQVEALSSEVSELRATVAALMHAIDDLKSGAIQL